MKKLTENLNLKEYIWHNIKDLPKESIKEIYNYIIYVRKKNYQPEIFKSDDFEIIDELSQLDNSEIKHLEEEFFNYKNLYPHE